jgi:hypothetical protein
VNNFWQKFEYQITICLTSFLYISYIFWWKLAISWRDVYSQILLLFIWVWIMSTEKKVGRVSRELLMLICCAACACYSKGEILNRHYVSNSKARAMKLMIFKSEMLCSTHYYYLVLRNKKQEWMVLLNSWARRAIWNV